ncbi:cytochrome P450 [Streptomyces ambofaciens]
MVQTARETARDGLPKGFRSAELGWPELNRIPHPPYRLPLLGDIVGASRRTPMQDSLRYARRLGPIFRRRAFGKEFVFVWGASLAADLADETRFAKHVGLGVANLRPVAGDGLFTAYNHEPNWQLAHDVLAPGFSREAMAGYHVMMLDVAARLTGHWDLAEAAGRAVDVPGDMTKLTLETIARTGFGHDFGSFERTRPHPFVNAMVGTLGHAQRLNTVPAPLAPWLLRDASRRNAADIAYLNRTVDDLVRARRATGGTGGGGGDLLDRMLETAHPQSGERLSPENVRRQVITFLVAGHETTSGALSFALHYLARHPEVAARARAEVDRVWGDTEAPGYEQVARLRYVRRVLDESLRLWPTAPGFAREGPRGHGARRHVSDAARGLGAGAHGHAAPRSSGLGPGRRAVRPGPLRREGRAGARPAHVQAVRDRGAGLHRAAVRAARGHAGPRAAAAPLRPAAGTRLPAAGHRAADADARGAAPAPGPADPVDARARPPHRRRRTGTGGRHRGRRVSVPLSSAPGG